MEAERDRQEGVRGGKGKANIDGIRNPGDHPLGVYAAGIEGKANLHMWKRRYRKSGQYNLDKNRNQTSLYIKPYSRN